MIKTNNLLNIALTGIFALVPTAVFAAGGKASPSKQTSTVGVTKMNHHSHHHKHHKHHRKSWKYSKRSLSQQSY